MKSQNLQHLLTKLLFRSTYHFVTYLSLLAALFSLLLAFFSLPGLMSLALFVAASWGFGYALYLVHRSWDKLCTVTRHWFLVIALS